MSVSPSPQSIEKCRKFWANVAKKNGWYKEPFYVQVWADSRGEITDSVSFDGLQEDIVELIGDFAHCASCDIVIDLDFDKWYCDDYNTYCDNCQ